MSEPIGMSITVGGRLSAEVAKKLLAMVAEDLTEYTGPSTLGQLKALSGKNAVTWTGVSNYGECDGVKALCETRGLSYIHHCDAKYEYNASISWWTPRMKLAQQVESNQEEDCMVNAVDIKPLVDFCLDLAVFGAEALPLHIHRNKSLDRIIEKSLKKGNAVAVISLLTLLRKEFDKLLPVPPSLSPLEIT